MLTYNGVVKNSSFVIPNYNTRMRGNERMNIHTICEKEKERERVEEKGKQWRLCIMCNAYYGCVEIGSEVNKTANKISISYSNAIQH